MRNGSNKTRPLNEITYTKIPCVNGHRAFLFFSSLEVIRNITQFLYLLLLSKQIDCQTDHSTRRYDHSDKERPHPFIGCQTPGASLKTPHPYGQTAPCCGQNRPGYHPLSGLLPLSTTAPKTHPHDQPFGTTQS